MVVDSPREGGLGRTTLNGVKTEGQESKIGVNKKAVVEMNGPPFPIGGDTRLEGIRQPPEDEVQLKGGGVFEGVEEKVGVGVGDTEGVTDTVAEEVGVTLLVGVRVGVNVGEGVDVGVEKGRQVSWRMR
jgi:hypothetical protein